MDVLSSSSPDLADSVSAGRKLINTTAEIAIHVIASENKTKKKLIMPPRISSYLIDCRFNLKEVKRLFSFTPNNRLDHKEIILFPVLQNLSDNPKEKEKTGHYFLLVLNLKAERFEVMDSLRGEGNALMMEACQLIAASIKSLWRKEYKQSHKDSSIFQVIYIDCPHQTNLYDCGFFMLKFIELWDGRKMGYFQQSDMPNIRKLYAYNMVNNAENTIDWKGKFKE